MDDSTRIEGLVRQERHLRDCGDWTRWRACYHPASSKTRINISWFQGEIDDWVRESRVVATSGVATIHSVTPVDVTIQGVRGLVISACQITSRFDFQGAEFDLIAQLRLVSQVEHIDTVKDWVIVSLEGIYLQDRIVPVVPIERRELAKDFTFDVDAVSHTRSSYKCLIWNIERKGRRARRDLPGVDNPSSIESLMQRARTWLEECD